MNARSAWLHVREELAAATPPWWLLTSRLWLCAWRWRRSRRSARA